MTTEIVKHEHKAIALRTMDDVRGYAAEVVVTSLCPQAFRGKPRDAMIAILAGQNVGLSALESLQGFAVINGRPSLYGEKRTAVCLSGGQTEWVREWFEVGGEKVIPQYSSLSEFPDTLTACWQTKRRGMEESPIVRFSVADAKIAKLWNKAGPWSQHPLRMLQMRARAFGERDNFADLLAGIGQYEEERDIATRREPDPLEAEISGEVIIDGPTDEPPAEPQAPAKPPSVPQDEAEAPAAPEPPIDEKAAAEQREAEQQAALAALQEISDRDLRAYPLSKAQAREIYRQAKVLSNLTTWQEMAAWIKVNATLQGIEDENADLGVINVVLKDSGEEGQ